MSKRPYKTSTAFRLRKAATYPQIGLTRGDDRRSKTWLAVAQNKADFRVVAISNREAVKLAAALCKFVGGYEVVKA